MKYYSTLLIDRVKFNVDVMTSDACVWSEITQQKHRENKRMNERSVGRSIGRSTQFLSEEISLDSQMRKLDAFVQRTEQR